MREKEERAVVTFRTTMEAMQAERALRAAGQPGRLIPVPREITAGCGMAWCAPVESVLSVETSLKEAGVSPEQVYRLFL